MNALACFMEEVRLDDRVCLGSRHDISAMCGRHKGGGKEEGKGGKERRRRCLAVFLA